MPAAKTAPADGSNTRAPARGNGNPGMLIILGLLMLGFSILIVTLQTQTNEAYINHEQQKSEQIQAQWNIWLQIPKLMFGDKVSGPAVTSDDLSGIIVGQGTELVYLATIIGRRTTAHASRKAGRVLGIIAIIFLIGLCIFDFYTDAIYGVASPDAHLIYAIFCTFVIGFFPTWGLTMIEHGVKQL